MDPVIGTGGNYGRNRHSMKFIASLGGKDQYEVYSQSWWEESWFCGSGTRLSHTHRRIYLFIYCLCVYLKQLFRDCYISK